MYIVNRRVNESIAVGDVIIQLVSVHDGGARIGIVVDLSASPKSRNSPGSSANRTLRLSGLIPNSIEQKERSTNGGA